MSNSRFSYHNRSLEQLRRKLEAENFETFLEERSRLSSDVRVLEIGCGQGRILLELRKLFPEIELHGVNKEEWPANLGSSSLITTAMHYEIFKQSEIENIQLPELRYCDAADLPFDSEYFDLIYSQVAFHYVKRKDRALEEIIRVLRPQGRAHLHVDTTPPISPDFFVGKTPRFVIYQDQRSVPIEQVIASKCGDLLEARTREIQRTDGSLLTLLHIIKLKSGKVSFQLTFDTTSSFSLESLSECDKVGCNYGYRSVFRLANA